MHDLSTIKQMNKLAAVKKAGDRAKLLNRTTTVTYQGRPLKFRTTANAKAD